MAGYGVSPMKGCVPVKPKKGTGKLLTALLAVLLAFSLVLAASVCVTLAAETEGEKTEESQTGGDAGRYAKSNYPKLAEDAGFGDRMTYGLKIVGIGMSVVFLVLIILMAVLYVFKLFSSKNSKQAVQAPENKTALPSAGAQDDEETIVAVATAAIAASRGESECAFRVISVRKLS